jgi:hypothetical protein
MPLLYKIAVNLLEDHAATAATATITNLLCIALDAAVAAQQAVLQH